LGGKGEYVLCADGDGCLEVGGSGLRVRDEEDATAPRKGPLCTPVGRIAVEQDGDRTRPHLAAGRFSRVHDMDAGRGADAIDIVAQLGVADQDESSGGRSHGLTMRGVADTAPSSRATLWMNSDMGTAARCA
jgi:hypothetical protein